MTQPEDKLTEADLRKLAEYKALAIEIGMNTKEADWAKSERTITQLYQKVNQPAPTFMRCVSPADMVLKYAIVANDIMPLKEVQKFNNARIPTPPECTKSMIDQAIGRVFQFHGNFEIGWVKYYQFCRDVLATRNRHFKEEDIIILDLWDECGNCNAWWSAFERVCFICDRPEITAINSQNQLHNEAGPAFRFRTDAWSLWSIRDVQLPFFRGEKIVMRPQDQTIEEMDAEQNEEIRSICIGRYGWHRYLEMSGAEVLDARYNEIEGCEEALMKSKKGDVNLVTSCPTARLFALPVRPTITTCIEAQKWLHGDRKCRVVFRT